jgi:hypothetical protein
MSNVFTLDSLREEVEKKFAPVKIALKDGSEVILASVLRLDSDIRKTVVKALEEISSLEDKEESPEALDHMVEAISKVLNAIADKPQKLLQELHSDDVQVKLHMMTKIVSVWAKETQLGEA